MSPVDSPLARKRTLKTLYYRLKMDKEFEAIEKELNK